MKNMRIRSICKFVTAICVGLVSGFLIGATTSTLKRNMITPPPFPPATAIATTQSSTVGFNQTAKESSKVRVAERLPPGIVASESDLYLRRLWGDPSEDFTIKPNYLVSFTVGYNQRDNINAAVKKFPDNFTILLFHYDGITSEWDEFDWSKRAIHVSATKQTKWWYAKRFLHPDVLAPYDYIFLWDEDLGVEHFDAEEFVEIMAPVFSRDAWRCMWHLIQNDLVHGWGLDFYLQRCVEAAHEKIGVVDAQWIVHQFLPSLGNQGLVENGRRPWEGVRQRCRKEWDIFKTRITNAERSYYESMELVLSNFTGHA